MKRFLTILALLISFGALSQVTVPANRVNAGPVAGPAGPASFRLLVAADIPTIPAGTKLSGQVPLANGGTAVSLTDPGSNKLWGWDDTDNTIGFWTIGSGLSYDHSSHTLSASGGGGITVGTTTISSGTNTKIGFNDSGVYGEGPSWDKVNNALTVNGIRLLRPNLGAGLYLGLNSGNTTSIAVNNVAIGGAIMGSITSGDDNVGIGSYALQNISTGNHNTGIGSYAYQGNGSNNTAIGYGSFGTYSGNGSRNTAVGSDTFGNGAPSGDYNDNVVIGYGAGLSQLSGDNNVLIGSGAQAFDDTGSDQLNIQGIIYGIQNNGSGVGRIGIGIEVPHSKFQTHGSFALTYVEKTSNYTLTIEDYVVHCSSGSFTVTLPTAVGVAGRIYIIKNTSASSQTLATTSGELIDGSAPGILATTQSIQLMSTGSGWITIK